MIHSDANDHNVLVGALPAEPRQITGLIDFGDMHLGLTVAEVAIGATYALLGKQDPLAAAASVISRRRQPPRFRTDRPQREAPPHR